MKIQIAIPSRGDVRYETLSSVVALTTALDRGGIAFRLSQYHYYDVAESRNHLARTFLEDAEATHLLFVDADMGFAPEAVARLIAFEAPVVGAIYPRRGLSPERVVHLARELPDLAIEQVIAQARNYVLFNGSWEGEPVPRGAKDGFLRVNGIGMGLTLLARTAMKQVIAAGQAPLIESQTGDGVFHDFFGFAYSKDGRRRYSDDLSFCRRWRLGCGGEIWADAQSPISHVGTSVHTAAYETALL
ncbi:MAG: hypothetical protein AAGK00_17990 [Pseudomonadota bacterium]